MSEEIIFIMGPTASGKSALAMDLARRYDGEVISADSMQFYRELNIGTAKPSTQEQKEITHHLIDIASIHERIDVFNFVERAETAIKQIRQRGRQAIVAGGSGLYLKALIYGLDPMPADPKLRTELDALYDNDKGFEQLKEIMQRKNPEDFARWQHDRRKLIRSFEVFSISGRSISELQKKRDSAVARRDMRAYVLNWEREALRKRIAERCTQMLECGWIDEAKTVLADALLDSPTAHQAIGYRIIGEYLDGKIDYQKMIEKIVTSTWQFARRQLTWFRNQHPEAKVISMPGAAAAVV